MNRDANRTKATVTKQITDKIVALEAEMKEYGKHYADDSAGMRQMKLEMQYLKLRLEQVMNSNCPLLTTH